MSRSDDTPATPLRRVLGRVAVSAGIWSVFGVVVGVCIVPDARPVSVIASVIAGVIVLTPFGAVMGLCGGRWLELVGGGAFGLCGGVLVAAARGEPWGYSAALGLIMGGQVGATAVSFFWRLPRLLKRVLLPARSAVRLQQPELA